MMLIYKLFTFMQRRIFNALISLKMPKAFNDTEGPDVHVSFARS